MILPTPIGKHLGWIEKDRNIDDDDSDGLLQLPPIINSLSMCSTLLS